MKSIMDLLVNLAGENVIKFFQEKPPKDTPVAKMEYNYLTCYYIIRFLYVQGAVLPHVCPEHLLTYEDYLLYTEVFPTQERLSHVSYKRKQQIQSTKPAEAKFIAMQQQKLSLTPRFR